MAKKKEIKISGGKSTPKRRAKHEANKIALKKEQKKEGRKAKEGREAVLDDFAMVYSGVDTPEKEPKIDKKSKDLEKEVATGFTEEVHDLPLLEIKSKKYAPKEEVEELAGEWDRIKKATDKMIDVVRLETVYLLEHPSIKQLKDNNKLFKEVRLTSKKVKYLQNLDPKKVPKKYIKDLEKKFPDVAEKVAKVTRRQQNRGGSSNA